MTNPYIGKPPHQFWRQAVAMPAAEAVDPVVRPDFLIGRSDRIATAGSCFAQHIARTLVEQSYGYFVTEAGPPERGFGVFPARFGNIYTARQLRQLFERAYYLFEPEDEAWDWDGRLVDPFRPRVEPEGFADLAELRADRERHLAAVRTLFEEADVFVFTLGLTEAWRSVADGAVVPLAPGVHGRPRAAAYEFVNFRAAEIQEDLAAWIELVRKVNPTLRIILTVSPVPLVATYEDRHVLVSTAYSKAALRTVAGEIAADHPDVAYFPSYEIVTGPHNRARFYAEDLREVTPAGVGAVMALFRAHYLGEGVAPSAAPSAPAADRGAQLEELEALSRVICDEEALDVGGVR